MSPTPLPTLPPTLPLTSDADLEALVEAFESSSLTPDAFDHARHVAVATAYLARGSFDEAHRLMRDGVARLLRHHGLDDDAIAGVYNETITLFWLRLLAHLLDARDPGRPLWAFVNATLATHGSMRPAFAHYSRERLFSAAARRGWLEPDLVPLPF